MLVSWAGSLQQHFRNFRVLGCSLDQQVAYLQRRSAVTSAAWCRHKWEAGLDPITRCQPVLPAALPRSPAERRMMFCSEWAAVIGCGCSWLAGLLVLTMALTAPGEPRAFSPRETCPCVRSCREFCCGSKKEVGVRSALSPPRRSCSEQSSPQGCDGQSCPGCRTLSGFADNGESQHTSACLQGSREVHPMAS